MEQQIIFIASYYSLLCLIHTVKGSETLKKSVQRRPLHTGRNLRRLTIFSRVLCCYSAKFSIKHHHEANVFPNRSWEKGGIVGKNLTWIWKEDSKQRNHHRAFSTFSHKTSECSKCLWPFSFSSYHSRMELHKPMPCHKYLSILYKSSL